MVDDRGQKTQPHPVALVLIIGAVVAYVAYGILGPITYTFAWWHLIAAPVVVVVLLTAYGTWLIGRGSDAEFQARQKSADSKVFGSGFFLLDWARTATLPVLGEGKTRQRYRCPDCRHTWTDDRRSGWPPCPNCGHEKPEVQS